MPGGLASIAGCFVALDGIDGGGKTGAIAALEAALGAKGLVPLVTREPGGTEGGLALRRRLLGETGFDWTPKA
jgi:dTMP kinase